jgi:hypothetical protein
MGVAQAIGKAPQGSRGVLWLAGGDPISASGADGKCSSSLIIIRGTNSFVTLRSVWRSTYASVLAAPPARFKLDRRSFTAHSVGMLS